MPAVSIVVPNYKHAPYLRERLDSIFSQSFKDFEVILLDDASTDGSIDILKNYARYPEVRLVENKVNSGSAFSQWFKGMDMCRSDLIWIAESDDFSDPAFLERVLPLLGDQEVVVSYCASRVVDSRSRLLGYYADSDYLTGVHPTRPTSPYVEEGRDEIVHFGLGVKNTILSISSIVIRRFHLTDELRRHISQMHFAGDWLFALAALRYGKISYVPDALNTHRRHESSVID